MSTKLKISVTKEVLWESRECGGMMDVCAVSVAIRDIFPDALTGIKYIYPYKSQQSLSGSENEIAKKLGFNDIIKLPQEASAFIRKFDQSTVAERVAMQPISFEISIPDKVIEKINIEELRPLLENHPTLELIKQKQSMKTIIILTALVSIICLSFGNPHSGKLNMDYIDTPPPKTIPVSFTLDQWKGKIDTIAVLSNRFIGKTLSRDESENYIQMVNSVLSSFSQQINAELQKPIKDSTKSK